MLIHDGDPFLDSIYGLSAKDLRGKAVHACPDFLRG
jgi:hypothetical protein